MRIGLTVGASVPTVVGVLGNGAGGGASTVSLGVLVLSCVSVVGAPRVGLAL